MRTKKNCASPERFLSSFFAVRDRERVDAFVACSSITASASTAALALAACGVGSAAGSADGLGDGSAGLAPLLPEMAAAAAAAVAADPVTVSAAPSTGDDKAYRPSSAKYSGNPTAAWMSAKLPSCRGPGGTPSLRPSSAVSIARIDTPSSDRGYATSLKPIFSSCSGRIMGVLPPPSSMLAILGRAAAFPPSVHSCAISASLSNASTNRMSAPASANAAHRAIASSIDTACRASVRATMRMSAPSSRASAAARMRKTASSRDTTRLPRTWPHDLGDTWSSIRMPANPACA
mmetsp:Transcript_21325/g.63915  ORF Transcript_21325/g.63915 Transcript_21325/m.63915 type:complete len:291 (+) Transcript_21325:748-1620(+)